MKFPPIPGNEIKLPSGGANENQAADISENEAKMWTRSDSVNFGFLWFIGSLEQIMMKKEEQST